MLLKVQGATKQGSTRSRDLQLALQSTLEERVKICIGPWSVNMHATPLLNMGANRFLSDVVLLEIA